MNNKKNIESTPTDKVNKPKEDKQRPIRATKEKGNWKGGRKKLGKESLRKRHGLMLSTEEKAQLLEKQEKSNYNDLNSFIRARLFDEEIKYYYHDKNKEVLIRHLSKIGGNINQIAHKLNTNLLTEMHFTKDDLKILHELMNYLREMKL